MKIDSLEELTAKPLIPTWLLGVIFSIAVVVVVGLIYAYGQQQYKRGEVAGSVTYLKRANADLAEANDFIIKLQREARDAELAHAARLAELDKNYQEEKAREKAKTDATERDLRNGNARLLVAAKSAASSQANTNQSGQAQPSTGSGDAEARCELSPTVSAEIYGDYARANEITKQLGLCQEIVAEDRRVCGTEASAVTE
jgi:hypothetical protein